MSRGNTNIMGFKKWGGAIAAATFLHVAVLAAFIRPPQITALPTDEIVVNLGLVGTIAAPQPVSAMAPSPKPVLTPKEIINPVAPKTMPPKPRPAPPKPMPIFVPIPAPVQVVHAPSPIIVHTVSTIAKPVAHPKRRPISQAVQHHPALTTPLSTPSYSAVSKASSGGSTARHMGSDVASGIGSSGPEQLYYAKLAARMKRYKRYPASARKAKQEGTVVLHFTVNRGGRITRSKIVQSSGFKSLDSASLRILKRVQPLPAFPPAMKQKSVSLTYPFTYRLTTGSPRPTPHQ